MKSNEFSNLMTIYFSSKRKIHEYFGYVSDWKEIPLDGMTDEYWFVIEGEDGSGQVVWAPEPFTEELITAGAKIYSGSIYTQCFLPKYVYPGKDYTMISVDTHTDGNKLLMVFDNAKKCTDQKMIECWNDR